MRKGNRVRWDAPPQTCKNPSDIYVLSSKYGEYHIEINRTYALPLNVPLTRDQANE